MRSDQDREDVEWPKPIDNGVRQPGQSNRFYLSPHNSLAA